MEKRKVIVKDKTLLELAEDAYKGDVIDLKEVVEVDTSYLDMLIESGKEKAYEAKLAEFKKRVDAENELKIKEYESKINLLKEQHESDLKIKSQEIDKSYADQISDLKNQINLINEEKNHDIENLKTEKQTEIDRLNTLIQNIREDNAKSLVIKEQEVAKNYSEQISELKNELDLLKETKKSEIESIKSKNDAERSKLISDNNEKYSKLEQEFNILKAQFDSQIRQVKNEMENEFSLKIKDIEANNKLALANKDAELQKKDSDFEVERIKIIDAQKEKYDVLLKEKEDVINNL